MPTTRSADKRKSGATSPAEKTTKEASSEKKAKKGEATPEAKSAAEKTTDAQASADASPPYAALAVVPSIVSHDAEAHVAWVLDHVAGTEKCGEAYKDDKGLVMHAVVAISNKHGKQHVYFGDAKCLMSNELDECKKSTLAEGEFCKGAQMHLNFDTADDGKAAWAKATTPDDDDKHKAVVLVPYEPTHWGALYGMVRDPWGFVWAFCSPLPPKDGDDNGK